MYQLVFETVQNTSASKKKKRKKSCHLSYCSCSDCNDGEIRNDLMVPVLQCLYSKHEIRNVSCSQMWKITNCQQHKHYFLQ